MALLYDINSHFYSLAIDPFIDSLSWILYLRSSVLGPARLFQLLPTRLVRIVAELTTMHIPIEIILQALQDLPRTDLKAARLVSKQWSSCATRFLFDVLYISPHKTNINVFQSIVQHPVLRGCVTKLVYDGIGFSTKLTYSQYFERLWKQMNRATSRLRKPYEIPDSQISRAIELSRLPTSRWGRLPGSERWSNFLPQQTLRMAEEECSDFEFIKAGY